MTVHAQLTAMAAELAAISADVHRNTPAGQQVAVSVDEQIGSALLGLRVLADRVAVGNVYAPITGGGAYSYDGDDLVEVAGPMYALTASQLRERDEAVRLRTLAEVGADRIVLVGA